MNTDITTQLTNTFYDSVNTIVAFLPDFVAGLIILLVGWMLAVLVRGAIRGGLNAINTERFFGKAGAQTPGERRTWIEIIAQVAFWTILIFFLIPTLEAWNLAGATLIIGQLLGYLPNVIGAVIIGFLGFVFARLVADAVAKATQGQGKAVAATLSNVARYALLVFTGLIVLQQLRIAPNLINILFSAVMFGLALAVGLAFGLGGRTAAERMLDGMMKPTPTPRPRTRK